MGECGAAPGEALGSCGPGSGSGHLLGDGGSQKDGSAKHVLALLEYTLHKISWEEDVVGAKGELRAAVLGLDGE